MGIIDPYLALVICVISYLCFSNIKIVSDFLDVIGKHSMNMFLTHSFVMAYFLNNFTYSFKWPELILLVLLIDTLIISYIIEKEKYMLVKLYKNTKI